MKIEYAIDFVGTKIITITVPKNHNLDECDLEDIALSKFSRCGKNLINDVASATPRKLDLMLNSL